MLGKFRQLLSDLPPPDFPADQLDFLTLVCVCGKRLPIKDQPILDTGLIKLPSSLCPDCRKEVGDYSHLVCVKCRRVVTSVKPHKESDGFIYEKGRLYHTLTCPVCDEALRLPEAPVQILERHIFKQMNRL
jgi:hypothetical protein